MGGDIQIVVKGKSNNEVYGDVLVKSSDLLNVKINKEIIPLIIDEIPILTVARVFAEGAFELRDASELRFKVSGSIKKQSEPFDSYGDHRIAMAFAILSSLLKDGGEVKGFESVSVSNPDFLKQLNSISS